MYIYTYIDYIISNVVYADHWNREPEACGHCGGDVQRADWNVVCSGVNEEKRRKEMCCICDDDDDESDNDDDDDDDG